MTDINARIAVKNGYTPMLCPCGCGVTGWRTKDGIFLYNDWENNWDDAGELLEEMKAELCYLKMSEYWLCTIRAPYIRHNADTPQMAIALAWLEWRPTPPEGE